MLRFAALLFSFAAALSCMTSNPSGVTSGRETATVLENVILVDGTGAARRTGAVRIVGDTIESVGEVKVQAGDQVVDGEGKILAPGFIDTHSHHDDGLLQELIPLPVLTQGLTTIVIGQDGVSHVPLADFYAKLEANPPAINVASYVGHGTIRSLVMGGDFARRATPEEVRRMEALLRQDLDSGALGLSTGLEYDPGIYSDLGEVVALAKVTAEKGKRYISHIRSEDRYFEKALEELIEIGRQAKLPVQVSHMKLATVSLWGKAGEVLAKLDKARAEGVDVTADVYPYTYWQSTMTVLFPERDFDNRESASFALRELAPPETFIIADFDAEPSYVGKTLVQVAKERKSDPVTALMDLIRISKAYEKEHGEQRPDGSYRESIIATSMHDDDVETLLKWAHTNVSSDGTSESLHPRGRGSFPRVIAEYVRKKKVMTLEEAVHKMTGLAAAHMGIEDRGVLAPGMKADLVLFDEEKMADRATPDDPFALSEGVVKLYVNGELVFADGKATGSRPGRVLRGSSF